MGLNPQSVIPMFDRLAELKHFLALDGVRHRTIREQFGELVEAGIREETFNGPSCRVNLTAHEEANPQYRDEAFRPKYFEPLVRDLAEQGLAPEDIYEEAFWRLIPAEAAKQLAQRHRESQFLIGYASTEILTQFVTDDAPEASPAFRAKIHQAAQRILAAKQRMRRLVGGDNFFIKVPVTRVGLAAVREAWQTDFAGLKEEIQRSRWAPVLNINFTAISTIASFEEALELALWAKRQFVELGGDPASGPAAESRLSYFVRSLDDLIDELAKQKPALAELRREARAQRNLPTVSVTYFQTRIYNAFRQRVLAPGAEWQQWVKRASAARPPLLIAGSTAVKIGGQYQWAGSDAYALRVRLPYVINTTPLEVIDPLLEGLASGSIQDFDRVVTDDELAQSAQLLARYQHALEAAGLHLETLQAQTHQATITRFLQDEAMALDEIMRIIGTRQSVKSR